METNQANIPPIAASSSPIGGGPCSDCPMRASSRSVGVKWWILSCAIRLPTANQAEKGTRTGGRAWRPAGRSNSNRRELAMLASYAVHLGPDTIEEGTFHG